jgi:tetratricopeptide (TPR) repeat protein
MSSSRSNFGATPDRRWAAALIPALAIAGPALLNGDSAQAAAPSITPCPTNQAGQPDRACASLAQPEAPIAGVESTDPIQQVAQASVASPTADVGLDRVVGSLSWLLIAFGLAPLATTAGLWLGRRRVVNHLVQSVRRSLKDVGDLDRRVKGAATQANRSLQDLQEQVERTKASASALSAELETHGAAVKTAADQELSQFQDKLAGDRRVSRHQIAELEKEFISNMQILAGQAERQKAKLLQDFTQKAPQELLGLIQPQIQQELRTLVEQLVSLQMQQMTIQAAPTTPLPASADNIADRAEQRFRSGDPEGALAEYDKAIDQQPDCYAAWWGKGVVLEALQRYPAAIAAYDRAVRLKPDSYESWHNRGLVLMRLGKFEEAAASYQQAIGLNPNNPDLWLHQGLILSKLQQIEPALKAYNQAISLNPDSHEAWYNRANALARLQRPQEALQAYDRAIELNDQNASAWHNRGIILTQLGNFAAALSSYDRAIDLDRQDPEVWYSRGNVLVRLDCFPEAIDSYNQALALNPKHDRAQRNHALVSDRLSQEANALQTAG